MLTVVETVVLPIVVAMETAGASQTHQALELARRSLRGEINFQFTCNIIRRDSTWNSTVANRRCMMLTQSWLSRYPFRRNSFKQETARPMRAQFADSQYRADHPSFGIAWNECIVKFSRSSSIFPRRSINGSDVLLCHQYSSPASLPSASSYHIVLFCSALAAFADSSISRRVCRAEGN